MLNCSRFLAVLCAALMLGLSGCISKMEVDTTASTGGDIDYAYVTVTGVWFHTNADAAATDAGWQGKTLDTPVTFDLAQFNDGALETILSGLMLPAGTYRQMRLVLADNASTLLSSAEALSLSSNAQVDYLDSSGTLNTVPLELADASGELILPITIKISNTASGEDVVSQASGSGTGSLTKLTSLVLDVNALRGITAFDFSGQAGSLFTPRLSAFDESAVGGITGTLDLSATTYLNRISVQSMVVTAETLSADGSHYLEAKSVAVPSTGSFTIYPLPVPDSGTAYYDLVIHGPGIQTMVIAAVPVTAASTTSIQTDSLTVSTASTYPVNADADSSGVPRGTQVDFYQTLPADLLPHLIESATLNPFSGAFTNDTKLSTDTVLYGAYAAGDDISFSAVTPQEGVGSYLLGTRATLHDASAIGAQTVTSTSTTSTVSMTLPTMSLAGALAGTVSGTLTLSTAGAYDEGFILLTHGGQLIDVVNLADALSATGASGYADFSLSNVPSNLANDRYEISARLWNSSDPAGTLARVGSTSADLRYGSVSGITLTAP